MLVGSLASLFSRSDEGVITYRLGQRVDILCGSTVRIVLVQYPSVQNIPFLSSSFNSAALKPRTGVC